MSQSTLGSTISVVRWSNARPIGSALMDRSESLGCGDRSDRVASRPSLVRARHLLFLRFVWRTRTPTRPGRIVCCHRDHRGRSCTIPARDLATQVGSRRTDRIGRITAPDMSRTNGLSGTGKTTRVGLKPPSTQVGAGSNPAPGTRRTLQPWLIHFFHRHTMLNSDAVMCSKPL
jgi:hypothetical protein